MARKFLYAFAGLIVLFILALLAFRLFGNELLRLSSIPGGHFSAAPAVRTADYDERRMWLARPDIAGNPTLWTPRGWTPPAGPPRKTGKGAAIFFVHPTSFVSRDRWNAPLDDAETNARTAIFLRGEASAFSTSGEVWAPRYRQATFGAFLTDTPDSRAALDLAYADVAAAFDAFLHQVDATRPIILAGHSQGSRHLIDLLRQRVARDTALKRRIVAVYAVGWPISRVTDLAALGMPECATPDATGCVLSWATFAEPADPSLVTESYDRTTGFDGRPRDRTPIVCTNPLAGRPDVPAPTSANLGTLFPAKDLGSAQIAAGRVPARCVDRGFLMIGDPPDVGPYVLPGNNYHVYDYSLFWANVRADAERRLAAFEQR